MSTIFFREKIKLQTTQRRVLYLSIFILWITGALWVAQNKGAVHVSSNETFAPSLMKIHGAFTMIFTLLFGSLLMHIQRAWALKLNQINGVFLILYCVTLSITGWLLYYSGDLDFREKISLLHWIGGFAMPLLIYLHIRTGKKSLQK